MYLKVNMNLIILNTNFLLKYVLFILIVINSQSIIFSADINAKPQEVELLLNHTISIQLDDLGNPRLNYLNFQSYYILETIEPYLNLNSFSTDFNPEPRVLDNEEITYFEYSLSDFNSEYVEFSSQFEFTSIPNYPKITSKIEFPLNMNQYSLEDVQKYTQFTPQINTNSKLQERALELASGEDDVLLIATKVANWVQQEIEYDLSTVFENPNQNAVEIFDSKQGVCKELSIVYASMLRSLGIPVRINSGFGYTTSEEIIELVGDNWGGHAWTEVLIGDKWVPFDLTYQQYGYVDSSHIPLQQTVDMEDLGVRVEMSSRNLEIVPNTLNSEFEFILNSIRELDSSFINVDIELNSEFREYEGDSNVILSTRIKNNEDFYQIIPIEIIFPKEMVSKTNTFSIIVLPPSSTKTHLFIVKMPSNMEGFSFPVALYTKSSQYELQDEISISQRENSNFISDIEVEEIFQKITQRDEVTPQRVSELNLSNQLYLDAEDISDLEESYPDSNLTLELEENTIKNQLESFKFKKYCKTGTIISMQEYELSCDFTSLIENIEKNGVEVNSFELCSGTTCNLVNQEDGLQVYDEVLIQSTSDLLTRVRINSVVQSFSIEEVSFPQIDFDISITNSVVSFENTINHTLNDNITLKIVIGSDELVFDANNAVKELDLKNGNYVGVAYLYYKGKLVDYEKINFTVERENILSSIQNFFKNIINI